MAEVYFLTGRSYNSAADWDISTKFGMQVDEPSEEN